MPGYGNFVGSNRRLSRCNPIIYPSSRKSYLSDPVNTSFLTTSIDESQSSKHNNNRLECGTNLSERRDPCTRHSGQNSSEPAPRVPYNLSAIVPSFRSNEIRHYQRSVRVSCLAPPMYCHAIRAYNASEVNPSSENKFDIDNGWIGGQTGGLLRGRRITKPG